MPRRTQKFELTISRRTSDRLARLARARQMSAADLAAEAIQAYLELDDQDRKAIIEGLDDIAAGRTVDQARVAAWVESWDSPDELPRPKAR